MAVNSFPPGVFGIEVELGYYQNRDKLLLWRLLTRKKLRITVEDELLLQQVKFNQVLGTRPPCAI